MQDSRLSHEARQFIGVLLVVLACAPFAWGRLAFGISRAGDAELELEASLKVDLCEATPDALQRLPGVGAALAGRIIEARDRIGLVEIDDLEMVRGVGPAKISLWRPVLRVGPRCRKAR